MADRRLQVFHAVAKHLSFTKAADVSCMTQPAGAGQDRVVAALLKLAKEQLKAAMQPLVRRPATA